MRHIVVAVSGLNAGENPQPGPGVIRSLRRRYADITIVGLVYDALESGIYAPDGPNVVYRLPYPSAGSDALLGRLDEILAEQPLDLLIPTLDTELQGLLKLHDELVRRGVRMLLPRQESYKACRKSELPELGRRCGAKTPASFNAADENGLLAAAAKIGFPLMVKGPYYGAQRVYDERTLVQCFAQTIAAWGGPVVAQECIVGGEFNVMAVADGEGEVAGLCALRKTILTDKGKGFGGITVRDERLQATALDLIRGLKWRGPLELEFIQQDSSEEFYLIEINPRFPAWVDFPSAFGHNLPALVVERLINGRMPKLPEHPAGKFFVRHSIDLLGDIVQLGELSTTGRLSNVVGTLRVPQRPRADVTHPIPLRAGADGTRSVPATMDN